MPFSDPRFRGATVQWIIGRVHGNFLPVLDVGAGCGTYGDALRPYCAIDAVEIYEPYVDAFALVSKYRSVTVADIRRLNLAERYSVVILGDVLEHLTVSDAIGVLDKCADAAARDVVVQVPFCYPQDAYEKNEHEAHVQDDLTPELMHKRYEMLEPLFISYNALGEAVGRGIGVYHLRGRT